MPCTVCDGGLMFDLHVEPGIHFYYVLSQFLQGKFTWPRVTNVKRIVSKWWSYGQLAIYFPIICLSSIKCLAPRVMEGFCLILMCFDVQDEVDPLLPLHNVFLVCYENQNNEPRVSKVSELILRCLKTLSLFKQLRCFNSQMYLVRIQLHYPITNYCEMLRKPCIKLWPISFLLPYNLYLISLNKCLAPCVMEGLCLISMCSLAYTLMMYSVNFFNADSHGPV